MKSKNVKIMALVLCAVLVSSCFVATTVSKYKTDITDLSDSARVAKWTIGEDSSLTLDLFGTSYKSGTNVVVSSAVNVIAPGTSSSATITFVNPTTPPEVNYELIYTVDANGISENVIKLIESGAIEFKINGVDVKTNELATAYSSSAVYAAGTKPETDHKITISWNWKDDVNNEWDTSAGIGAATSGDDWKFVVKVTATAEQTNKAPTATQNPQSGGPGF